MTAVPLEMQTGRNILKGGGNDLQSCDPGKEYACAAKKEVSRLGFAFFGSDLMKVGNDARNILTLACNNYGKDILDRFLQVEEGR